MSFPVFDLHCDTPLGLLGPSLRECGSLQNNDLHIDLQRAAKLPGYAQCFACFTSPEFPSSGISAEQLFERQMIGILREIEANKKTVRLAYTAADVRKNFSEGLASAILTIEGPAGFGYDPALLEDLYKIGFRITTLGWNEKNVLTGSHCTDGGLTDMGREYVQEAQRLGMIVDVSHISDSGFWDIMKITTAPVIASHSNSRAVWNVSRNITDDMFRAICQTDGTVGINQYAGFLGEAPTMDTVSDHILHFMNIDPSGRHISLGGDLDGCGELPDGFTGVQDYPNLAENLLGRGLDQETVRHIFWNNALEVMERCCM